MLLLLLLLLHGRLSIRHNILLTHLLLLLLLLHGRLPIRHYILLIHLLLLLLLLLLLHGRLSIHHYILLIHLLLLQCRYTRLIHRLGRVGSLPSMIHRAWEIRILIHWGVEGCFYEIVVKYNSNYKLPTRLFQSEEICCTLTAVSCPSRSFSL